MASQKKIKQRACNGDVAEFCEMVMLKEARKHMEKLDHRWLGRCCGLAKETSIWWLFTEAGQWPRDESSASCRCV